jgi:AcrR family transcriptional regulator
MARPRSVGRDRAILDAAAPLFHERGFESVSIDQIGAVLGLTGPAIYRYFSSKEEILTSLLDEALDGLIKATAGVSADAGEELVYRVRGHVGYLRKRGGVLVSIWQREGRALASTQRRRLHRREEEYFADWIGCVARCFPEADGEAIAVAVYCALGALNTYASWPQALRESPGLTERLVVQTLTTLSVLGPLPPAAEIDRIAAAEVLDA